MYREPNDSRFATLPDQSKVNHAVVMVSQVNEDQSPPSYQPIDEFQEGRPKHDSELALVNVERPIVQLDLSEVDYSSSSHEAPDFRHRSDPSLKLIEVQEKVRCLATNKKERRDARQAEKAMKWEAWKERKQAKRAARAAWKEERRAVRA